MKNRARAKSRVRLWVKGVVALLALLVGFIAVTSCVGPPSYYSEKYSSIPRSPKPRRTAEPIKPIRQTEGHTCGFCALSVIYTAYGLDPEAMRLRFRLGTDMPVTKLDKSTTGTLPQDIDRVIAQDGFDAPHVDAELAQGRAAVRAHLAEGHVALALVRVNELHWIVLSGLNGDNAVICDSLKDETYEQPLDQYLKDRVLMIMLVRPKD